MNGEPCHICEEPIFEDVRIRIDDKITCVVCYRLVKLGLIDKEGNKL